MSLFYGESCPQTIILLPSGLRRTSNDQSKRKTSKHGADDSNPSKH